MIRINDTKSKTTLKAALFMSVFLLFAVATGFGQQQINLTAGPATITTPDGTVVPMWGYSCGAAVTGSTATCAPLTGTNALTPSMGSPAAIGALGGVYVLNGGAGYTAAPGVMISAPTGIIPGVTNRTAMATAVVVNGQVVGFNVSDHGAGYVAPPTVTLSGGGTPTTAATAAASPAWSPIVITIPTGASAAPASLTINLTNSLSFGAGLQNIPTSMVIVGQVGGGLGGAPVMQNSPDHTYAQTCPSWFVAANPPGTPCTAATATKTTGGQLLGQPPIQTLGRLRSMGTEVAAVAGSTALSWANLKPGTYLLESGTQQSIQVPMGLIGMLVVTNAPGTVTGTTAGTAYPAVLQPAGNPASQTSTPAINYSAEVPLEFSEIDPVQNKAVDIAVRNSMFDPTRVWSGLPTDPQGGAGCGNPASGAYYQSCYPPAVNYTPFYYLINGLAFDRANPAPSLFAATAGVTTTAPVTPVTVGITGTVLVRMVNAGLRMHVPAIVGAQTTGFNGAGVSGTINGFTVVAEDGNPIPDADSTGTKVAPRVKNEVFMAAGKTFDVMVNVPATVAPATAPPSLPVFDRELSLSANSSVRDAGMLAYIGVNGAALPTITGSGALGAATANADKYAGVVPCLAGASCVPMVVSDPSKGVIANDINVYGVALAVPPANGNLTCAAISASPVAGICANGTFTYTPNAGAGGADTFWYCANGTSYGAAGAVCAQVTLSATTLSGAPSAIAQSYTSKMATYIKIPSPGLLAGNSDPNNLPLSILASSITLPVCANPVTVLCGSVDPDGGFTLAIPTPTTPATTPATGTFTYQVQNSQGVPSAASGNVTVTFPVPSNLKVNVLDAQAYNTCNGNAACIAGLAPFSDYRWIIEEDKTFFIDPNCTTNQSITTPGCPNAVGPAGSTIPVFGVQFHTSTMDFVAQGCTGPLSCEGGQTMLDTRPACNAGSTTVPAGCSATAGQHIKAVCDVGNGACRPDTSGNGSAWVNPSQVQLDPHKRYFISVLPGDAGSPFTPAYTGPSTCNGQEATTGSNSTCGHSMSGAPIAAACNVLGGPNACTTTSAFSPVNVLVLPTPLPTGKLSVLVFEDDFPLNGEQDGGGGTGAIAPIEPGLGGFNLVLWDTFGSLGDATGQDTYDMFNQPLANALAGTTDPVTGLDACPTTKNAATVTGGTGAGTGNEGITGMIVTCPKYEADGTTLSPLAGQAVVNNLMPEKFSVQAYPGADRIARGEEWIQTNTLDGQHPHDSFIEIGDPSYFQEYGPAGYHVMIGFANPAIINARHNDVCNGNGSPGTVGPCTNTITGQVNVQRLSRIPDERLYPSGSRDALAWTQCWVSLGDPDGEDFMFTKCDANGNFSFGSVPGGNWRLTIGDQWNDQIIDGLSTPANVGCTANGVPNGATNPTTCPGGQTLNMGNIGVQQWQSNLYTKTCMDTNKNGICDPDEIGIPLIYTMIHYRDGHNANALTTDFNGIANFNESFPLFNWYVVEADSTRYKTTGIHTVYDAGGPADGSSSCGTANGARQCGTSTAYNYMTNTFEAVPLPGDLSVPGADYCAKADCTSEATSFAAGTAIKSSSTASTGRIDPPWVKSEGWSGLTGHSNYIEFGKAPYAGCNQAAPTSTGSYCATVTTTPTGSTTPVSTKVGENGGIYGQVAYASTRPFDSAAQMIQQPWEPNVPGVTVNLYQEGFAADGVTKTLTLVDTTTTSSWDAWAQGFYPGTATAGSGGGAGQKPYLNCPGQGTDVTGSPNQDLFYYTLFDQPNYLDWYNFKYNAGTQHTLPYNSQFKCYDAMKINNQLQPAPFDGKYYFPSVLGIDPTTGKQVTPAGVTAGVGTPGTANFQASHMAGTNCTICVANPDSTDPYRVGTPMLPPGKYTVEVIMPPGYEVYKEEDKNLLIGDNFIAPAVQQFGGLGGAVFIIPDQASVASMYDQSGAGYNGTNYQNSTTGEGLTEELSGVPGFPGYTDPVWPCVGEMRVVPDYLSEFPQALETAPFAGATRPLCDRKEVTLTDQMAVNARFFIFTTTHIAAKYTGVITDDFTSEFDPFAPQFGEKFAPPNMSVSTKDYLGNELSRVYADHWGTYDGLTFSSWDVNPPNITGYSPSMLTQCMNDPGPVKDTNPASPTFGQMITDPLYQPAYSNFCYINPFMPGVTTYNDTPVVPTQAFVGAGYNNSDCSYPDATPAIKEVDTADGVGPWMKNFGETITITSLGIQQVNNSAYSGPSANTAPFNMKTVPRNYGFGSGTGTVTVGGVPLTNLKWSNTTITGTVNQSATVNSTLIQMPFCPIQQQAQYGGSGAFCGQLVITAANGKQSIDTVTLTIGGKMPKHIDATASVQSAIDAAAPGDLLIVDPTCMTVATANAPAAQTTCTASSINSASPSQTASVGSHNEMLIMWKPVRLQGVGAASSVINAAAFPAGKLLDPWRRHVNCLFDLTLQGVPIGQPVPVVGSNPPTTTPATYDPSTTYSCPEVGWKYYGTDLTGAGGGAPVSNVPQIDRLPLEATVGWDASLNGNLAEQLQEPSLMGAFEGAAVTVLAKGLDFHGLNPWGDGAETGGFPTGTTLLTGIGPDPNDLPTGDSNPFCTDSTTAAGTNPFPSNFMCNPSSIDGLSLTGSSQGGGGVFAHGWAHHLQVANNRVYNNAGTLSGGISIGQGEFPGPYVLGGTANAAPGSCSDGTGFVTNQHLPYCLQIDVNVHHNMVTTNSSLGDELFSGTLSGSGGVTFCTGNDYYKFNYNWVCGNMSTGEGGGLVHLGEIQNGDIEHNSFILNQSINPTVPTNGGGIMVQGTPDTDPTCTTQSDQDCPPGLSDGIGHDLVINANLIQANSADSGAGGGIRLQQVNGTDVANFSTQPQYWNNVTITNNIIVNNVAGWDGAGISLQDSLKVAIINNTIAHNDTLASSGDLTQSIGTPNASAPAGSCSQAGPTGASTASCAQPSGLSSTLNSSLMTTSLHTTTGAAIPVTCPFEKDDCATFSHPLVLNDLIYENRAFYIGISAGGAGNLNQQNLISLYNQNGTAAASQTFAGECFPNNGDSYWDVGVRGDSAPGNHGSGHRIEMQHTLTTGMGRDPRFVSKFCNGSRVPPECSVANGCGGPSGFGVPPGIADALTPNPRFTLNPSATVDEGNNWINVSWGPMAISNPAVQGPATPGVGGAAATPGNWGGGPAFGNYTLQSDSGAIDQIPVNEAVPQDATVPSTDFFGNRRPDSPAGIDYGAVEFQGAAPGPPVITLQPTNQIVFAGNKATFTVAATGTPTLTYQWQYLSGANWRNFGAGTGLTSATMTTFVTTTAYNGLQLRVLVTDGNALSTTSNVVILTVNPSPAITQQPTSQAVFAGNKATFTVAATGTPNLTYRWQYLSGATWRNFGAGTGLTSATMTTFATTAAYNGLQLRVVVTDGNGHTANSNPVTLTVNPSPVITVQPTAQTVFAGNTATFTVAGTGSPTLTYQWQYLSGATWRNFGAGTGLTSATMTTFVTTAAYNGIQLRVVVTDGNSHTATSNPVTLTVNPSPVITVQPTSQTTTSGNTATFNVTATGSPALTYQWQYLSGANWVPFGAGTGLTSATMTTFATTPAYNGLQLRVVVTDGNTLSTTSNTVTLAVH